MARMLVVWGERGMSTSRLNGAIGSGTMPLCFGVDVRRWLGVLRVLAG